MQQKGIPPLCNKKDNRKKKYRNCAAKKDASVLLLPSTATGLQHANKTIAPDNELFPFPSSATVSMINYANFNQNCVDACLTKFLQYCPFIILIEVEGLTNLGPVTFDVCSRKGASLW